MNERPNNFAQNGNPISTRERVKLPDEQLRALAPSVFAAQSMPGVSSRYAFVPTAKFVARLRGGGQTTVSAVQKRVKLDERWFQKDLIRFQRRGVVPVDGEQTPELCLTNCARPKSYDNNYSRGRGGAPAIAAPATRR